MLQTDHFSNFLPHPSTNRKSPHRHPSFLNNQPLNLPVQSNRQNFRSSSPNKLNATKKPVLSNKGIGFRRNNFAPQLSGRKGGQSAFHNHRSPNNRCENHPQKPIEYTVSVDGELLGYCQRCAINMASTGFEVTKINSQSPHSTRRKFSMLGSTKPEFPPFNFPEYSSVNGYEDLREIVKKLDEVFEEYQSQIRKFQDIEGFYEKQYTLTQNFYDELINHLEMMKKDHLDDLIDKSKQQIQSSCIKEDDLKTDMVDMEVIRKDFFQSLNMILENFDDSSTQKNLAFYKQRINMFSQKIYEENQQFEKDLINQTPEKMQKRIQLIQNYLMEVWKNQDEPEGGRKSRREVKDALQMHRPDTRRRKQNIEKNSQSPLTNIIQIGNQPKRQEGAFRRLFEDDEKGEEKQLMAGQISPQFKNI